MSSDRFSVQLWILIIGVAVLSATAGVAFWKIVQIRQAPSWQTLIVLPEPRVIDDFALTDQQDRPFSLNQLRGHWSLMFFGFTHCPDVCPTALYELKELKSQLQQRLDDETSIPQIILVSVDPERDTSDKLAQYLAHFDPDFVGVTGPHENLAPLTRQIGIAYRIEEHQPGEPHYSVDHSSGIMLMNPAGQLFGVFPAPQQSELMMKDLIQVLENS